MSARWWSRASASSGSPTPVRGTYPDAAALVALRARSAVRPATPHIGAGMRPGPHRAAPLGRGMEFAEVRAYQPGDDVRSIDWRHTARRGWPCTKLFHEERERPVQLLVDLGASMRFGTRDAFKSVAAARAAALLAWAVVDGGDRVGALLWDGARHTDLVPRGRQAGALALIGALAAVGAAPAGDGGLGAPLRALARSARPGTLSVLVSDFHGLDSAAETELLHLARHGAVALVHIHDPLEAAAPPPGRYRLAGAEGTFAVDLHGTTAREAWTAPHRARVATLARLARGLAAPCLTLATDADPAGVLAVLSGFARSRDRP